MQRTNPLSEHKFNSLYSQAYFLDRMRNDRYRAASFQNEKHFVNKVVDTSGICLDIGCGTGEFLAGIEWRGRKIGIEISEYAAKKASKSGVELVETYGGSETLDAVFYRGTIQHLDSPFRSIQKASEALKADGVIFFLATPNIESLYYRIFNNLPALDPERNFYLPGSSSLKSIMRIYGMKCVAEQYPYLQSPYSKPVLDHLMFTLKLCLLPFGRQSDRIVFPFWKNMMNLAFRKS